MYENQLICLKRCLEVMGHWGVGTFCLVIFLRPGDARGHHFSVAQLSGPRGFIKLSLLSLV